MVIFTWLFIITYYVLHVIPLLKITFKYYSNSMVIFTDALRTAIQTSILATLESDLLPKIR